jgi:hypothetical protein
MDGRVAKVDKLCRSWPPDLVLRRLGIVYIDTNFHIGYEILKRNTLWETFTSYRLCLGVLLDPLSPLLPHAFSIISWM